MALVGPGCGPREGVRAGAAPVSEGLGQEGGSGGTRPSRGAEGAHSPDPAPALDPRAREVGHRPGGGCQDTLAAPSGLK